MAALVPGDFHSKEVYKRQLTANDMEERSRLSIKKAPALIICPEVFSSPEETYIISLRDLRFYDAALITCRWSSKEEITKIISLD
jgi:hypothetical protein